MESRSSQPVRRSIFLSPGGLNPSVPEGRRGSPAADKKVLSLDLPSKLQPVDGTIQTIKRSKSLAIDMDKTGEVPRPGFHPLGLSVPLWFPSSYPDSCQLCGRLGDHFGSRVTTRTTCRYRDRHHAPDTEPQIKSLPKEYVASGCDSVHLRGRHAMAPASMHTERTTT